jgi:hypothetical protein
MPMKRRFNRKATSAVVPEPRNGSRTIPGLPPGAATADRVNGRARRSALGRVSGCSLVMSRRVRTRAATADTDRLWTAGLDGRFDEFFRERGEMRSSEGLGGNAPHAAPVATERIQAVAADAFQDVKRTVFGTWLMFVADRIERLFVLSKPCNAPLR